MSLRLVMMGTGEFALPTFRALLDSPHEVVGLFTQPDRTGRGHHHHRHPMKELALEHETPVFQPPNVNAPEELDKLRLLEADLFVVAAYGQILSAELLEIPRLGAINLHASLLPKYRGAAPVQYSILKGEQETGVTIFQIAPRLDAGPILGVIKTEIGPKDTSGTLAERLAELAVPLTIEVIDGLESGNISHIPQDAAGVTRAPRLNKTDGEIDWNQSAEAIDWQVRAMQPWPKAFTHLNAPGEKTHRLIILEVEPDLNASISRTATPGTVVENEHGRLVIQAGQGFVELISVQPDGKRAMSAEEFLRGHHLSVGDRFFATPADNGSGLAAN